MRDAADKCNYFRLPAFDMAGATNFASSTDKIKILFTPQFKATSGRGSITAYRKFMANLMVIDNELSKKYELLFALTLSRTLPISAYLTTLRKCRTSMIYTILLPPAIA